MTAREQHLFDALCAIRKTVADRGHDSVAIQVIYEIATRAVRQLPSERTPPNE